jgi:hypothetical protein
MAFDGQSVHRAIERPRIKQSATGTAFVLPRDNESKPLLFLHVPKTAGSSVYSIFRTNLKPPELLKLHLDGKSLARLTALPRRQASRLRMLYGHVDVQLARQIVPLQQCVTLLRDPVDRLISFYAFAKHMNSGPHSELARRTTITQWIDALCLPETDNGMVRRLSGAFPEAAIGRCSRQMLERAKANLAQFALIGLTHRFDEFYALLASRLGLAMRTFVVSKVNAMRPRFDQLHADTLAELEQRSALDRELYRFAEGLFLQQMSKVDLSMKIADFRLRCGDRSMRIRDAARRIAFARWKRVRSHWSPYPFLG